MTKLLILVSLTAASGQSFEVASIRVHNVAVESPVIKDPGANPIHISGNRVDLRMVTLKDLVMAAYNVKEDQVSGGPAWIAQIDSMWDVAAKAPGTSELGLDQARSMLQTLLADRFRLKFRRESKQLPVYNLVVGKSGPKMKQVAADTPPAPGMRRGSMEQLAALLSLFLGRPAIDKTGLPGLYEYSVRLAELDMNAPDSAEVIARTLTAIQDQLGLRAEAAKATLELLIIEGADKPTEN